MQLPHKILLLASCVALSWTAACTKHEVDVKPLEIKPIHITIDINLKVDKALDDFFSDLDEIE